MVVALRAPDAEAEEKLAGDIGEFRFDQFALAFRIRLVPFVNAMPEVAGGYEDVGIFGCDLVTGKLLADETVVGLVFVEGLDDIVAVRPCVRAVGVLAVAIGLGIAGKIQPMLRPTLAVTRGG